MARVEFTPNLSRHVECRALSVEGGDVREILDRVCAANSRLKTYLLDDQDRLRKHVTVFIDNVQIRDRRRLSDPVGADSAVYIAQALSGG